VRECIKSLGLQNQRAKRLIQLSASYAANPPVPIPSGRRSRYFRDALLPDPADQHDANLALAVRNKACKPSGEDFSPVSHLPGSGKYAQDSYRIYCGGENEWRAVLPTDKELIRYLVRLCSGSPPACPRPQPLVAQKWRWAVDGVRWDPMRGVLGVADPEYIGELADDLVRFDPYRGA
jgi:methyl-CpG-binding domain protein 4